MDISSHHSSKDPRKMSSKRSSTSSRQPHEEKSSGADKEGGANQPILPGIKPTSEPRTTPEAPLKVPLPEGQKEQTSSGGSTSTPREDVAVRLKEYEIPTPREIRRKLRKYVAGCDQLLKDVSIFAHEHLQRAGSYFAVPYIRDLLQRNFYFKKPHSQEARELVYAVTRIARNNKISNSKNSNPYKDILGLTRLAKESGLIRIRPEIISHRATSEEKRAQKDEVSRIVRSIASARNRAVANEEIYSKIDFKKALARRYQLPESGSKEFRSFDSWLTRFHNAVRQGEVSVSAKGTLHDKVRRYLLQERVGKNLIERRLKASEEKSSSDALEKVVHGIVKALHQTQKRHRTSASSRMVVGGKESLCIIGDTGTGKTQTIRALEAVMPEHIPIIRFDASTFTEVGYEGNSIAELPERLIELTEGNPEMASRAVVFFDEFDKKRHISGGQDGRDIAGIGVQHALLRVMEDGVDQETGIDFSTVGFIFGGSFQGLDEIVAKRLRVDTIGFRSNEISPGQFAMTTEERRISLLSQATETDLERYGMAREWVGRVDLTFTEPVGPQQMKVIMEHPQGPYRTALESLEKDDVRVLVTEEAKDLIVSHALAVKKGARGLRTVMKKITREMRFEAPELKSEDQPELIVDENMVKEILGTPNSES